MFNYSYNKQVISSELYNNILFGLPGYLAPSVPLKFLDYDVRTFDIVVYYETSLSPTDETRLDDIINAYVYVDTTLNATFNEINTTSIINTSGGTFGGESFFSVISATTYYGLPTDVRVTGGTYDNGTAIFTNNTGGTFNVTGFITGGTDYYVTGGTYDNSVGILTLSRQNGDVNISGFSTGGSGATDYYVTGGTYDNNSGILTLDRQNGSVIITGFASPSGTTDIYVTGGTPDNSAKTYTFTNNAGGTFTVDALTDITITGITYSNNEYTLLDNTGGTFSVLVNTMTGLTVNGALSATTISATSVTSSDLRITTNPVSGYILTSNANGDAMWQAPPTPSSGSTTLDMQTATGNTSVSSVSASSTWVDIGSMIISTKNLGSSATTYVVSFSCTALLTTNAGSGNIRIVINGNELLGTSRNITNGGPNMAGISRAISTNGYALNVKNGDIIKVQFNSPTGQLTVTDRALSITGILTINLV